MNLALIASLLLAYAGMLGLCLGMERHWKQLASPRLPAFCRLSADASAHRWAAACSACPSMRPASSGPAAWQWSPGSD